MPQLGSPHRACSAALFASLVVLGSSLSAQSANAPAGADPNALLLAAAGANGAPGDNAEPWHAKISFTLNDWEGKPELQGSVEEFWAAPDKIKLIYATSGFDQVEYRTSSGIRRTGSRDGAPLEITHVVEQFLHPIPLGDKEIGALRLQEREVELGAARLWCISPAPGKRNEASAVLPEAYCLSAGSPILRLSIASGGFARTIRNGIVQFEGHYIPQTIERLGPPRTPDDRKEHVELSASLDTMEALGAGNEGLFTPPADAVPPRAKSR